MTEEFKLDQAMDVLTLGKFVDAVSNMIVARGFGEINLKVVLKNGDIKMVYLTKEETWSLEHPPKKEE